VYGLPTNGYQEPEVSSDGRTRDEMTARQEEHMGGRGEAGKPDLPERIDLLHPKLLSEIGNLELIARQVLQGFLIGLHGSSRRGRSATFAENRLYNPGDDLRFVDWKVFGRSDRLYVKQWTTRSCLPLVWAFCCSANRTPRDWSHSMTACENTWRPRRCTRRELECSERWSP
jgi:uncharacterized protein (DUF58 family)